MRARKIDRVSGEARPLIPLSVLLSVAVLACGDGADRTSGFEARDSSGIRITVNSDYQWPEGEGWRLSDQPRLDIGTLEGNDHYQFFRIINAVTLGDGRIVVANSGTNELRFFDSQGEFLFSSGRKGGGPGEFEALWTISALAGDSILVFDRRLRRMSVFAPDGAFVRSFMFTSLAGGASLPMPLGLTEHGNLVVSERAFGTGETRTGFTRDSTYYLLVDADGALVDTLGFFPDSEWYIKTEGEAIYSSTPPFARSSESAVHGSGFYFGSSDSYEIAYYSADGTLTRLIRRERPNLDVTSEDLERYKSNILERTRDPSRRQFWQSMFAEMPVPETMPAYGSMLVDAQGNLWVGDYRRPGDEQPLWTVFDPDGVMLGVVETPQRFRIYEIGSDYVLGRGTDDLDVEHIQIYGLLKN